MNSSVQQFLNIEGFISYLNHTGYEIKYTNHEHWKPLSFFFQILSCLRWGNDIVTIICHALVIWRTRRTMPDVCKIYISNCDSQLMFASSIMTTHHPQPNTPPPPHHHHGWVNNRESGDLRRHSAHYNVIVMYIFLLHIILWHNMFIKQDMFLLSMNWNACNKIRLLLANSESV